MKNQVKYFLNVLQCIRARLHIPFTNKLFALRCVFQVRKLRWFIYIYGNIHHYFKNATQCINGKWQLSLNGMCKQCSLMFDKLIFSDLLSTNPSRGEDPDAAETREHHRSQRNHLQHGSSRQTSGEMRIESAFLQHS